MVAEPADRSALEHILKNHAFTRGLRDVQITQLASISSRCTFKRDELILVEGQRSRFLYLLLSGNAAVELSRPLFAVCVQALGPGEAFGWSALLDQQDTLFRVRAREQSSVLRVDGAALRLLCQTQPDLGVEVLNRTLELVGGRIRATEARFAELCGTQVDPMLPD